MIVVWYMLVMMIQELRVIYVLCVSCCCWNLDELSELKYKLFCVIVQRV